MPLLAGLLVEALPAARPVEASLPGKGEGLLQARVGLSQARVGLPQARGARQADGAIVLR